MIKATIGESKPQEKPFPKIMATGDFIILFTQEFSGVHLKGPYTGQYVSGINKDGFEDYNEPITLQNE
jgi:hypothetical protein